MRCYDVVSIFVLRNLDIEIGKAFDYLSLDYFSANGSMLVMIVKCVEKGVHPFATFVMVGIFATIEKCMDGPMQMFDLSRLDLVGVDWHGIIV